MNFLDNLLGVSASHKDSAPAPYLLPLERRDYAAAVPLLKSAAAREDAQAMGFLAALTALGRGVEKNPEDACAWFRQAAHRGHVLSQAAFGMCLATGNGVALNRKEGAYWLYRAGQAGNLQAVEVLAALAYKDNSVVGEHFSEEDLCKLVMQLRKPALKQKAAFPASTRLH